MTFARVCRDLGHTVFYCAGELDSEFSPSLLIPEAHFTHPDVVAIHNQCLGARTRSPEVTDQIHDLGVG